jgi:cytoskeleton protein RodZ
MAEIGATLREARMRARIDVSEIEAGTKIRAKYLRALENEEWDLLPGPTFVKSFLRTYGQALGLDGRALVEEYKLHYEHSGEGTEPVQPQTAGGRRSAGRR